MAMMPVTPWAAAPVPHSESSNISTESATIVTSSLGILKSMECADLIATTTGFFMAAWTL